MTNIGCRRRGGRLNTDRSSGGFTRGSVVARPQRKQMSALSAMSVPQCLQSMVEKGGFLVWEDCTPACPDGTGGATIVRGSAG